TPVPAPTPAARDRFASIVREYLLRVPCQLPSAYLYDALGSALFDAICELPWYRITRAEARLLERHAADIFRRVGGISTIVELGSGNGDKLRRLVSAGRREAESSLVVHLVDLSGAALQTAERTLRELDGVAVVPHRQPYESGLDEISSGP